MDIKEFSRLIKAKRRELSDLMRRKMPVHAGRLAKDHYQDNFRKGGFVNGGLHKWPKSRRLSSGGKDAASNYGTLLSSRNMLFGAIKYVPGDSRVKVSNDLVYAPAHNWGDTLHPTVTPKMRRFAWAKYYQAGGGQKKGTEGKEKAKNDEPAEALNWKKLALTKKEKLDVKIPQRQFLGESTELTEKIADKTETEIRKILNS